MDRKKCTRYAILDNYPKKCYGGEWYVIHKPLPKEDTTITITFCGCSEKNETMAKEGFVMENLGKALRWIPNTVWYIVGFALFSIHNVSSLFSFNVSFY